MSTSPARRPPFRTTVTHCLPFPSARLRRTGGARSRDYGLVYFIYCEAASAVKIGFTTSSLRQRLGALQSGNPHPLRLLLVENGSYAREDDLHAEFRHHWMRGEWYAYRGDLADYIEAGMAAAADLAATRG